MEPRPIIPIFIFFIILSPKVFIFTELIIIQTHKFVNFVSKNKFKAYISKLAK